MSKPRGTTHWTAEQDQMIVAMRGSRLDWSEIAEHVGRSVDACSARYRAIIPRDQRAYVPRRKWTEAQTAALIQLKAEGKTYQQIASYFGKKPGAIYSKLQDLQTAERIHLERVPRVEVPDWCLEDRDRRLGAELSITAEFFGDPRPGQSALDKKQGASL